MENGHKTVAYPAQPLGLQIYNYPASKQDKLYFYRDFLPELGQNNCHFLFFCFNT